MAQAFDHRILDDTLAGCASAGHWYLGFSGGVDSTVLLYLLQAWRVANAPAPPLTAIHVNHQLQSGAPEWARHCARTCRLLDVPLLLEEVTVESGSEGVEAAARAARYAAFEARLGAGDVLFLGHHLDDQVETFFLRLLRGAGVQGLAAMPEQRALGRGRLVRPLLGVRREQLEACAAEHGLEFVEDPSNSDSRLDRNYLRREVLPVIEGRWPGYRRTVARASAHLAGASDLLEAMVATPATLYSPVGDPGFPMSALAGLPAEAAAMALRAWLRAAGRQAPDQAVLEEFLRQLRESGTAAAPRLQTGAWCLQRYQDTVFLFLPEGPGARPAPVTLGCSESRSVPGVGEVALEPGEGEGLWLAPGEQLELRWRSGGERCRPLGRGSSTSLKKLLQERGIPPWWRDRVPLLYLGEELLAVGDLWLCHSSRCGNAGRAGERCWRPRWTPAIPGGLAEGFD